METERQILFRKYSTHIEECNQCKQTPRGPETMCDLGKAILTSYREALNKDASSIIPQPNPRLEISKMTWTQLAQTLIVLENKPKPTPEDRNLLAFIDFLLQDVTEIIGRQDKKDRHE